MLVVGFDTATPAVSVALHDGERVVATAFAVDARRHGELLAPMIAKVMADAGAARGDLTAVATGVGPGPYTGLRVGVVTARVLGAVLGIPVYGVCSLDVIAAAAWPSAGGREFLVATDARRKEVYWARYDAAGQRLTGPEVGAGRLDPRGRGTPGRGDRRPAVPGGVRRGDRACLSRGPRAVRGRRGRAEPTGPEARSGAAWPPFLATEPLYLRRPDAREPGPPKRVTPP